MLLVSFIVPCFNVGEYLSDCLDSIFSCDIPNDEYEVICVNDYSTDSTSQVLNVFQIKCKNLHIINHPSNLGPGAARNAGIRKATGEFLWFIDADDFISGQNLYAIIKETVANNLDVLGFNYCKTDKDGKEISTHMVFPRIFPTDGYSFVNVVFGKSVVYHMGYVVRFLYRANFIKDNQLYFPEGVIWEDTVYMPKSLLKAQRVASIPDVLYSYRTNPSSISNIYEKTYSAQLIYDWSFITGKELLFFSTEVEDTELKKAFRDTAVQKYINGFTVLLLRTNQTERREFYRIVNRSLEDVKEMKFYLNCFNKLLLCPLGLTIASISSVVYKVTHR